MCSNSKDPASLASENITTLFWLTFVGLIVKNVSLWFQILEDIFEG